jgi:hypothetical protein
MDRQVDVCVIGGGPAGAALAIRLAQLGHSVLVVERSSSPRPRTVESLVPSVLPLLDALQVRTAIERHGLLRPAAVTVRWADPAIERRDGGWLVGRQAFDAVLLGAAEAAGADVMRPARILSIARRDDGWHLEAVHDSRRVSIASRVVADASGRCGWLPGRKRRTGPRLVALEGAWRSGRPQGMWVEAGERHWYWGASLGDGFTQATVFLDPADLVPARRHEGARAVYERLIACSELLSPCLQGTLAGSVRTRDATARADDHPATDDAIKVGDAAFALDPLSSHGVQSALGSALHAAAVVHTILLRPADRALAIDFYRGCQRDAVDFHGRAARRAYAEVARSRDDPFWRRRAGSVDPETPPPERHEAVAFDGWLQVSPDVRIEPGPVLCADFIVAGSHVRRAGRPTAFVGGVALAPLVAAAAGPIRAETLLRSWSPVVDGPRAGRLLQWLLRHQILQAVDCSGGGRR